MTIDHPFDHPDPDYECYDDDRTPLEFDDRHWDAFLPDDDQFDPLPEPGDFWFEATADSQPVSHPVQRY